MQSQAKATGHQIGAVLTSRDSAQNVVDELVVSLKGHDAAIDFSVGSAVARNVEACVRAGVPLVEGTTGWKDDLAEVRHIVTEHDGSLV